MTLREYDADCCKRFAALGILTARYAIYEYAYDDRLQTISVTRHDGDQDAFPGVGSRYSITTVDGTVLLLHEFLLNITYDILVDGQSCEPYGVFDLDMITGNLISVGECHLPEPRVEVTIYPSEKHEVTGTLEHVWADEAR